ncbi:MAG: FHA domain-containing protein [Pyrinomonadaceae bacterium]
MGRTLIGRDAAQCGVVIDEIFVSRLQAAIEISVNGQAAIKNLSSKHTTFVNGSVIDVHFLNDGDRVEFGAGQTVAFTFRHSESCVADVSFNSLPNRSFNPQSTVIQADRPQATSFFRVDLSPRLRLGRAPDNDVVLDGPSVSRYHAELVYENGSQPAIADVGSTNGTFVNGQLLRGAYVLRPDDWVTIGGYLFKVNGRNISKQDLSASHIAAFGVSKSYGEKTVLQDVSVALFPREFVGLMGASGCGKSTLMDVLNGMRPASSGSVFVNDLDLYRNFDLLRRSIGYVPQRDILHEALTVERTLYFAAKMRLPSGTSRHQIWGVIDEVIQTVGLEEQRHNTFRELSGGQQKRLSLGIELITKPNFLFLDEPTSPLDPETTENMMMLFRRLADEGRIVVMVTHKFERFHLMHNIVLLAKGRLAFFGPPREALEFFNCSEPSEIYRRLHEKTPDEACRQFRRSPQFQRHVAARFSEVQELISTGAATFDPSLSQTGAERSPGIGQWLTLTQRAFEIKVRDLRNTLILLAQAPIVALILSFITDDTPNDARTIFIAAIIAIWLGANNAIREIVSEKDVYARERLVNLKIPSYVLSKFAILSGIGSIQCFLFVVILTAFARFESADIGILTLILYLTLLAGAAIGLFFSALVSSTEKAMSVLPLILIPQLLLSGFLKPLDDLYVNLPKERPSTVEEYDRYQRDKDKEIKFDPTKPNEKPVIPEPVQKSDGLGSAKFLADLMTARWTIDALVHQVSSDDKIARDKLASRMTVAGYQTVLDKRPDSETLDTYRLRVRLGLFILALFSVVFLGLTIAALKRKDTL